MSLILSGTDGLSDIDGSAATPAIRGTDANTGIFFPAADTIAFSEGGVERMRLASTGVVGIGIVPSSSWQSDSAALQIGYGSLFSNAISYLYTGANFAYDGSAFRYVGTGAASVYTQGNGTHNWATASSGTAGNNLTFTTLMTLDASGNLGIGTTSPVGKLDVRANTNGNLVAYLQNDSTGASSQSLVQINSGGRYTNLVANYTNQYFQNSGVNLTTIYQDYNTQIFRTNAGTERLRIDSVGCLVQNASLGGYNIDTTPASATYAVGATQDFASMSGIIVANSASTGTNSIWICGGGSAALIANANGAFNNGTLVYQASVNGYRWTNTSGISNTTSFFVLRTRQGA